MPDTEGKKTEAMALADPSSFLGELQIAPQDVSSDEGEIHETSVLKAPAQTSELTKVIPVQVEQPWSMKRSRSPTVPSSSKRPRRLSNDLVFKNLWSQQPLPFACFVMVDNMWIVGHVEKHNGIVSTLWIDPGTAGSPSFTLTIRRRENPTKMSAVAYKNSWSTSDVVGDEWGIKAFSIEDVNPETDPMDGIVVSKLSKKVQADDLVRINLRFWEKIVGHGRSAQRADLTKGISQRVASSIKRLFCSQDDANLTMWIKMDRPRQKMPQEIWSYVQASLKARKLPLHYWQDPTGSFIVEQPRLPALPYSYTEPKLRCALRSTRATRPQDNSPVHVTPNTGIASPGEKPENLTSQFLDNTADSLTDPNAEGAVLPLPQQDAAIPQDHNNEMDESEGERSEPSVREVDPSRIGKNAGKCSSPLTSQFCVTIAISANTVRIDTDDIQAEEVTSAAEETTAAPNLKSGASPTDLAASQRMLEDSSDEMPGMMIPSPYQGSPEESEEE